jgi:hypothetical protein
MTNLVDSGSSILDCSGGHKVFAMIAVTNDEGELVASSENMDVIQIERIFESILEGGCPVCENLMSEK